jgi:ribulose-bisphosphate carboxylase small chain
MRLSQGTFSFLPDFTDEQVSAQIRYCLVRGWTVGVEFTDDPHPRNAYWEMWGLPLFDVEDPGAILKEIDACRKTHPERYVKVNAFDDTRGWETVRLSFIVHRPKAEPGFSLWRQETQGRNVRYTVHSYATDNPEGERYVGGDARSPRSAAEGRPAASPGR